MWGQSNPDTSRLYLSLSLSLSLSVVPHVHHLQQFVFALYILAPRLTLSSQFAVIETVCLLLLRGEDTPNQTLPSKHPSDSDIVSLAINEPDPQSSFRDVT